MELGMVCSGTTIQHFACVFLFFSGIGCCLGHLGNCETCPSQIDSISMFFTQTRGKGLLLGLWAREEAKRHEETRNHCSSRTQTRLAAILPEETSSAWQHHVVHEVLMW